MFLQKEKSKVLEKTPITKKSPSRQHIEDNLLFQHGA